MDIDFESLIRLQHLDSEIQKATHVLENIPRLIEDIEGKIRATSAAVASAKDKLSQNQKKRRDLETEVKDEKTQISKYKRQLNDVKTNKEYTSLLKEIEEAQLRIDRLEEEIISEMLSADDIEEEIKAATMKQGREAENLEKEKLVLEEKARELETLRTELQKDRQEVLPRIPADQIRLFTAISNKKGGAALSPVKGDFCALCHMRIRPQMLNEIRERISLNLCENCGRILYWPAKPEPARAG